MDGNLHEDGSALAGGRVGAGLITPVLLAGGSGTRLWPVSRASFPKQFAPILGAESLFQTAARRFHAPGFASPLIVTAEDFRFIVSAQLLDAGVTAQGLLVEPEARNTAPAALAAALMLSLTEPEALMLIAPTDHMIADPAAFRAAVATGEVAAREGRIVTFGIRPGHAETGYGWLECGAPGHPGVDVLTRFIEKPDPTLAASLLSNPRCLWNAGIFLVRADVLIAEAARLVPATLDAARAAVAGARSDLGFLRLEAASWSRTEAVSLDHAIMEQAGTLSVVRFDGQWTDLGSWAAILAEAGQDECGNALHGHASAIDCRSTLLHSDHEGVELVGIGLTNIVAVATRDAVLVADAGSTQSVRLAVETLKARGAPQATAFARDHRPWGWYETIGAGDRFKVKRIHVLPGAALSLQSHLHRAEHWVVVQGTARVTVGDMVSLVAENQSIYVPLGAVHRLENPGRLPMVLIEVQTGSYLCEDDIIRHEDRYART
jgi:mannose-1-phosphate guanylyltransferase/mannose-1-phosphate guanylyltransferase/mannose-6-phosphate isomerase